MNDGQVRRLGESIRDIRKARGLNLRALATRAGIDSGGLARLEHGQVSPRLETLQVLAAALDVSVVDLLTVAGFVAPHELPGIESYLRAKYRHLPDEDVQAIAVQVKELDECSRLASERLMADNADINRS